MHGREKRTVVCFVYEKEKRKNQRFYTRDFGETLRTTIGRKTRHSQVSAAQRNRSECGKRRKTRFVDDAPVDSNHISNIKLRDQNYFTERRGYNTYDSRSRNTNICAFFFLFYHVVSTAAVCRPFPVSKSHYSRVCIRSFLLLLLFPSFLQMTVSSSLFHVAINAARGSL